MTSAAATTPVTAPGILAPPDVVVGATDGSVKLKVTLSAPGVAGTALTAGAQAAQATTTGAASIGLTPTSGPPTSKVAISGKAFGAADGVVVDFGTTKVATATTSATGRFATSFKVPKADPPGSYTVTATDPTTSATAKFTVRTNWPSFRFNNALTGVNPYENVINAGNVAGLQTDWTESTSGATAIAPAVVNGRAYVPANNGFFVYDASSGALLWSSSVAGFGASSPAVAGGMVYAASIDGNIYGFSTTVSSANCSGSPVKCNPAWSTTIGGAGTLAQSSPTVAGGTVFVSAAYYFYALNAKTGATQWTAAVNSSGESPVIGGSTPAVVGGVVYVGGIDGPYGYNAAGCGQASCPPVWHGDATTNGALNGSGGSSPTVVNGVVYTGAGNLFDAFSASCNNCKPLWSYDTKGPIGTSPAVVGGKIYVGSWNTLFALTTAGKLLWSAATAPGDRTSPTVANGVVYIGSFHGEFAFNANGCAATTCNPLWTTTNNEAVYASPVVVNGILYQGGGVNTKYLYAYKLP